MKPIKKGQIHVLVSVLLLSLNLPSYGQLQTIRQGGEALGLFEAGDRFGASVASGDFNNDGRGDVAAGAPNERVGNSSLTSGFVAVNYGRNEGVGWTTRQQLDPNIVADVDFGASLASGDFNDDGYDDLAVGATGFHFDGRVYVYYGGASGLDAGNPDIFDVTDFGYSLNGFDYFGAALAVGYLEGDSYADLAIGSYGFGLSGAVFVLKGSANGLTTTGGSAILGSNLPEPVPANGAFGRALAFGDLAGLGFKDLIVGSPSANVNGSALNGMVHIIPGTANSPHLSGGGAVAYDWNNPSNINISGTNTFGSSFAVGEFADNENGDFDMVAISAPGFSVGRGQVAIAKGSVTGLQFVGTFGASNLANTAGSSESSDFFGRVLVAVDNNGDGYDDLAVSSPGEDAEPGEGVGASDFIPNAGVVYVVPGDASGLDYSNNTLFWHRYITRDFEPNTDLGFAMAKARITSGSFESLLIGAPGAYDDAGEVIDYAPWRQPAAPQCTSASVVDCDNIMIYALRPFEEVQVASTTKLMTCLLAIEATQLPQNDPNFRAQNLEYPIEAWMQVAYPPQTNCSAFNFPPNDSMSFMELIRTCMMVSGNDSAMAIADVITGEITTWNNAQNSAPDFVQMMNDRAAQIGMDDTLFTNPPGIDIGTPYSTAWDMQLLARTAMNNPLFRNVAGTTFTQVTHLVPSGVPPGFQQGTQNVTYNWLNNLQANVPSAIGIKPGGTPLAGTTGCMAAPDPNFPNDPSRIILANYFGIARGSNDILGGSRRARLLQFGIDNCPDPPPAPLAPNLSLAAGSPGMVPAPELPIGMSSSIVFSDPIIGRDDSPTDMNFVIQGNGSRASEGVTIKMHYRVLYELEPDEVVALKFNGVTGFDEIIVGNTESQPDASLEFLLDDGSGRTTSIGLLLPAVQKYTESAASTDGLCVQLANTGFDTNLIAIELKGMAYPSDLATEAPYRTTYLIEQSDYPIRTNADVFLYRTTAAPTDQSLTLAFAEPGTDFISYPSLERLTASAGRSFVLNWETAADYYDGFKIYSSTDLGIPSSDWTEVDDIQAGSEILNVWSIPLPADGKRFYFVEGYLNP